MKKHDFRECEEGCEEHYSAEETLARFERALGIIISATPEDIAKRKPARLQKNGKFKITDDMLWPDGKPQK